MSTIAQDRFVLPPDLIAVPLRQVEPLTRKRIGGTDDDVAVNRPGSRALTRVLDAGMAGLLWEFREPTRIVDAVLRYSRTQGIDPLSTLDEAFDALSSLINANFLLSADGGGFSQAVASFSPGDTVAGCRVERTVQVLEDTELYDAIDPDGQRVALKIGKPESALLLRSMLAHERAMLERLGGAVTPAVVASGDAGERPFLVTRWRDGGPVTSRAAAIRRLDAGSRDRALRRLCIDVLDAYASIHERGIVHGDIHPGNILVADDGAVSVIDFGRAGRIDAGDDQGVTLRAGVPVYYEPECARAMLDEAFPPPPTPAGEQYALAALLFVLITGRYYLEFSPDHSTLCRQVVEDPPLPFVRRGRVSWPDLERVLRRALAKAPEDRFPDIVAFRDAVAACALPVAPSHLRHPALDQEIDALVDSLRIDGPIFARGITDAPTSSVSFGSAGVAWFLYRLAVLRDDPGLLAEADCWSARIDLSAVTDDAFTCRTRGLTPDIVGSASPLHAAAGVHLLRAMIARARGDRAVYVREARGYFNLQSGDETGVDLSFGSAGGLAGAALLVDGPFDIGPAVRQELDGVMARLRDGCVARVEHLAIAREAQSVRNLGMAHGLAGIHFAILRACSVTGTQPPEEMVPWLERLAARAQPVGDGLTWPASVDAAGRPGVAGDLSAGWCRGSGGFVHLWAAAHDAFPARGYLEYAERAARHTWLHDALQPSLCCGLAGRALALARMYQVTGDDPWRDRARDLSIRAWQSAWSGDAPELSLFHGRLGVALAVAELEAPLFATMPLFGADGW